MTETWLLACPHCNHQLPFYIKNNVYIVDVVCQNCGWMMKPDQEFPVFDPSTCPYDDVQLVWQYKRPFRATFSEGAGWRVAPKETVTVDRDEEICIMQPLQANRTVSDWADKHKESRPRSFQ